MIDRKAAIINKQMTEIEEKFQSFIKNEDIQCGYTFTEFFSNHTSELLIYLNGERSNQPINKDINTTSDSKYANLMQFVKQMKEKEPELYEIAENFFWSSVVAAFLQRDQEILKDRKEVIHFYYDTSLVLALLDLADKDRVIHAIDLKEMIENAGHVVCVHPMTLREVEGILTTAANNGGPDINSGIFEAYQRRNLTPTSLLKISTDIRCDLEKQQVLIFKCSDNELDIAEHEYKTNTYVDKLGKLRNQNPNYKPDFREIHDVYMADFINKERKNHKSLPSKGNNNLIYFLTLNSHLIDFYYKASLHKEQLMIHPRNVIANLWINGALSKNLCKSGLSEIISRCLSANNIDTRSRMLVLVRYSEQYIEDKEQRRDFCRKAYKQIVKHSNTITPMVDKAIANWNENKNDESKQEELKKTLILLVNTVEEEDEKSTGIVHSLSEKVANLEASNRENIQTKQNLEAIQLKQAKEIEKYQEKEKTFKHREEVLKKQSLLLEKQSSIKDKIKDETELLHKREAACENSLTDKKFYIEVVVNFIILALISGIIYFVIKNRDIQTIIIGAGLGIIPITWALINIIKCFIPKYSKKKEYRDMQRKAWRENDSEYLRTQTNIKNLLKEQDKIEEEIKNTKNLLSLHN